MLRRRSTSRAAVVVGPLLLDLERRSLRRAGRQVPLSRTEWLVLERLAQPPGRGVPIEELLRAVRGSDAAGGDARHVQAWIGRLRRKLAAPAGQPGSIRYLSWGGYSLVAGGPAPEPEVTPPSKRPSRRAYQIASGSPARARGRTVARG